LNVSIKDFDVAMEVKNNGIELDVADTSGDHLGDLYITKTKLIWCKGKTGRDNGKKIKWKDFIEYMESK
jgi:eukaryotic-like serine/threonine-protein kinase